MYFEYLVLLIWITYILVCALYVPKREVYFIYYQLWIAKKPESRLPDQEEASMACTEYQIELEESMAYMHQCCGQKHSNRSWRHTDPSWSMQSCKSEIPLVLCTSESGSQCRYMCLYIVYYLWKIYTTTLFQDIIQLITNTY